jgi:hypothetical protein
MSVIVTLNVFSGRPNPSWTISEEEAADLEGRIARIADHSNLKALEPLAGLGYRGFSIRRDESPYSRHIYAGIVDPGHGIPSLIAGDREVEQWLLSSARTTIGESIAAHVRDQLARPTSAAAFRGPLSSAVPCPVCHAADAPVYNPALWNTPTVQPHNNCYNYANNRITNTFAQPGRATGHPITALSCAGTTPSAQSDGLVPAANFSGALGTGQGSYVALVIWPGNDYHWYRQDKVGCWSHKPGQTAARNTDNSGNAIADPKTCNRGPYTDFCTYMITKSTVHVG